MDSYRTFDSLNKNFPAGTNWVLAVSILLMLRFRNPGEQNHRLDVLKHC